jgi:hypothetical protein
MVVGFDQITTRDWSPLLPVSRTGVACLYHLTCPDWASARLQTTPYVSKAHHMAISQSRVYKSTMFSVSQIFTLWICTVLKVYHSERNWNTKRENSIPGIWIRKQNMYRMQGAGLIVPRSSGIRSHFLAATRPGPLGRVRFIACWI